MFPVISPVEFPPLDATVIINSLSQGLDLSSLPTGALADLNRCRLGYFGSYRLALVHAMEHVRGTRFNDRLVGDEDANELVGGAGVDWMSGEGGDDRLLTRDGQVDTVRCGAGADAYVTDAVERALDCPGGELPS